ncbi:MAG TPA: EAL domain-containing protein [Usitatibacter sp.]|nr:EAL domain-containing protein [Usitatibacter sp.]
MTLLHPHSLLLLAALPSLAALSMALLFRNRALTDRLEARARFYAMRDPLTGLPARMLLHDRLAQALSHAERFRRVVAVLFIDLDRFKAVNETLGHALGDEVLVEASRRLRECVRDEEIVARISGDEFVIALSNLERSEQAVGVARAVLGELGRAFDVGERRVYCTASIGIAVHPGDGTTAAALVQSADIAMYRAKEQGGNGFQFFLPEMHARAVRRLQLETALRGALERDEFLLHYQPKFDVPSDALVGFEALLRWRHPELGLLPPAEFVPILEESDLIVGVGEWVLREACRQLSAWAREGLRPLPVAVNISARQFRMRRLERAVARVVKEAGIDPSLLELEITESLLMEDPEEAVETLASLERFGVRLAVDVFGTGYSSLAYLRRFPIAALKIDRTFVCEAARSAEDAKIATAIINLGHSLGLKVIAEGVETPAQLEFLRAQGCDEMQGFLLGPPMSCTGAIQLLRSCGDGAAAREERSARSGGRCA